MNIPITFYKEAYSCQIISSFTLNCKEKTLNEIIWYNDIALLLKIIGLSVYCKAWHMAGVEKVYFKYNLNPYI